MSRRNRWRRRPVLERIEPRALPSAILALMASQGPGVHGASPRTSITVPSNQGAQGPNLILAPTGQPSLHELKREAFHAAFAGLYTIGPGQFSSESRLINIRAAGGSNQFLHGDIQIRLAVPTDPTQPISGAASAFDRNLNSNSVLGLDFSAPRQNVDAHGRPNLLTAALDLNTSAGTYGEGYFQGTVQIRYVPGQVTLPRATEQGKAFVRITGRVYTLGTNFILGNSNIDPGPGVVVSK